ncbi:nucleotidyltransferase [Coraliomargarita sinensis]|uniref:Nucleotidyltransferase n=1 Tax=Coraliomargarita sinensis TaxID=2174842 RepID=A0A317ZG83_9BACT|nr:nucleotidyltransferase [Coraliomargarita sinensis]PXA04625.1 nucleotidyltransferase [Coraliomargarita sinensis]
MSLNGYLTRLSRAAFVRDLEREQIDRSAAEIQKRIKRYFGNEVREQKFFGSYERGTILPRYMDDSSDVDLMIIFKDDGSKPQTHINRLRKFADKWYPNSARSQSSPTFALELKHVRFELVPAIEGWWSGIKIPAPRSDLNDWLETDPDSFSEELTAQNRSHNNQIKPLCRIMKYWNVSMGRPYESYQLEQMIAEHGFQNLVVSFLYGRLDLWGCFHSFASKLTEMSFYDMPIVEQRALERLQAVLAKIDRYQRNGDELNAENALQRVLPLKAGFSASN